MRRPVTAAVVLRLAGAVVLAGGVLPVPAVADATPLTRRVEHFGVLPGNQPTLVLDCREPDGAGTVPEVGAFGYRRYQAYDAYLGGESVSLSVDPRLPEVAALPVSDVGSFEDAESLGIASTGPWVQSRIRVVADHSDWVLSSAIEAVPGGGWTFFDLGAGVDYTWTPVTGDAVAGFGTLADFQAAHGHTEEVIHVRLVLGPCGSSSVVDALRTGPASAPVVHDLEDQDITVVATGKATPARGTLACEVRHRYPSAGGPLTGLVVTAQALTYGASSVQDLGRATTGPRGVATFPIETHRRTAYACRFGGTTLSDGNVLAPARAVSVVDAPFRLTISTVHGRRRGVVLVSGATTPARPGEHLTLRGLHRGRVSTLDDGRVDRDGRYAFRTVLSPGRWSLQVVEDGSAANTAGHSPRSVVSVRQPKKT